MRKYMLVSFCIYVATAAGNYMFAAETPPDNKTFQRPIERFKDKPAEFNAESRGPAEVYYSSIDPSFSKFVNLTSLALSLEKPDASVLTDVALGLAEGERILVRNHRSGISSDELIGKAVRLASRNDDKATLDRIIKASALKNKPQWAKLVSENKEFGGVSRDGLTVAMGKIDIQAVTLVEAVRHACNVAEITGQKEKLDALKKEVAASGVDAKVKSYLEELIENCIKSLPEKTSETSILLGEFTSASRGTSRLAVMSYATIRNATSGPLYVFVNNKEIIMRAGETRNLTLGASLGERRISGVSIGFENGNGYPIGYEIGIGNYVFVWTPNGLDLFSGK